MKWSLLGVLCWMWMTGLVACEPGEEGAAELELIPEGTMFVEEESPIEDEVETDVVSGEFPSEDETDPHEDVSPENCLEQEVTEPPLLEEVIEEEVPSLDLNLFNPADNLLAFTKTRGSLDPQEEVVYHWTGNIYFAEEADPFASPINEFPSPILKFEGYNIARFVPVEGGVRMISREMAIYKNPSGTIANCWNNAVLGTGDAKNVRVMHVFNDPVNFTISGGTPHTLGDQVVWALEVMLRYTSPLPVDEYGPFSASNTYESAEMFNFYTQLEDLNNPNLDTVPVTISWSRVGQLLPWMQGGQIPGKLVYHTHGRKLLGGFDELPENLKAYVLENAPQYAQAPALDQSPNATSWKVFKKAYDAGNFLPECE